ncbi:c-type cytochrome [Mucilaginibacter glaciei]|uniref:Photosynthetic reaction center cytochrome c subunit n=1 Tax=Mucilaginibacter glaciei TaxID=2772109 RepID=A0A926NIB7_9SPHI|nr:c-type cytochrome [Mucilaginibacter glaciei]MBD1391776.1 c-type cytochrome [Mucilaginibacter glaciei]
MINKKILATFGLLSVVAVMAMAPAKQEEKEKPKYTNLKVLPKSITDQQLHTVMDQWSRSLGARCGFCHARNEETKKMDFASDAKPEKEMARHMFKMTAMLNKKFFEAKKDSTGMMAETGVNCNTCHRGTSHPELVKTWPERGPRPGQGGLGGPPPGGLGTPPSGGQQGGTPPAGTPPPTRE